MPFGRLVLVAPALAMLACGGDGGGTAPDAAADAGWDAGPAERDAGSGPADPEPPRFLPCPEGWREVSDADGIPVCNPWPEDGVATCALHEAHRPGTPGCAAVGPACPASDPWPDPPPAGEPVRYVQAGATGGDGSRDAPHGTIQEAVDAAADGETILVAGGTYEESLRFVDRALEVRGACARDVEVSSTEGSGALYVSGGSVRVSGLRLYGSIGPVVTTASDGELAMRGVVVRGWSDGIHAFRGLVDVEDAVIESESQTAASAGRDATFRCRRCALRGGEQAQATLTTTSGRLEILDCRVTESDTRTPPERPALLLYVSGETGEALVERSVLEAGAGTSVQTYGARNVVMRDVLMTAAPHGSFFAGDGGLSFFEGVQVEMTRVRIEAPRRAIHLQDPGTTLSWTDGILRDVGGTAELDNYGRGINVQDGAALALRRTRILGAREAALVFIGTTGSLHDLHVGRTRGNWTGLEGKALHAQGGATVDGARWRFEDNREASLLAAAPGTEVTARDVTILRTLERECVDSACEGLGAGIGLGAYDHGHLAVDRFESCDNALAGVQVARDGELDLSNGLVCRNPIGANVQVPGYDLTRLTDGVVYRDNGRNLDATALPVPEL